MSISRLLGADGRVGSTIRFSKPSRRPKSRSNVDKRPKGLQLGVQTSAQSLTGYREFHRCQRRRLLIWKVAQHCAPGSRVSPHSTMQRCGTWSFARALRPPVSGDQVEGTRSPDFRTREPEVADCRQRQDCLAGAARIEPQYGSSNCGRYCLGERTCRNPISSDLTSGSKHSSFENRTEWIESRASERNGAIGE